MDKYVIDLDKVLDELELNDKYDESDDYNNENCNSESRTSTVQYHPTTLINLINDKIDVKDADFSIHLKPPKLLTNILAGDINSAKNVIIEQNNNIQNVEQVNKLDFIHELNSNKIEKSHYEDNLSQKKSEECEKSECQIKTTNEEKNSDNMDGKSSSSNFDFTILNGKIDLKQESVENCNKSENINTSVNDDNQQSNLFDINMTNDNNRIIHQEEKVISDYPKEKTSVENLIGEVETTKQTGSKEYKNVNTKLEEEPTAVVEDVPILDEDTIGKMTEKDLDKYLGDLTDSLENFDEPNNKPDDGSQDLENIHQNNISEQEEEVDSSTSKSLISNKLENNSIDSMTVECGDNSLIMNQSAQSNSQENENAYWSNELGLVENDDSSVAKDETQLEELEELLAATNDSTNNINNAPVSNTSNSCNSSETHGGLVQDIKYFERQEMPNGLTEEEQMLGKVKPFWIPDEDAQNCLHCDVKFTLIKRRHHCRSCGKVLCSQCCNFKAKLPYLEYKEARVCQLCYGILMRIEEIERINGHRLDILNSITLNNQMDHGVPDPNNPAEYCSTVPPLEQVSEAIHLPPPTVMVPVGVLKRPGSSNLRRPNNSPESSNNERETVKQVMFSDGVRPGGDLIEQPISSNSSKLPSDDTQKPITRTQLQFKSPLAEKILVPFENFSKRIKFSRVVVVDCNGLNLPPIINYNELRSVDPSLPSKPTFVQLIELLRNPQMPWITFGLTKNLHISTKIVSKTCCNSKECWSFSSKGLASVGQDEILFVLDCDSLKRSSLNADSGQQQISTQNKNNVSQSLNDVLEFPRDIFRLYTTIYDSASTANLYMDLNHIFFPDGLFNNKENSGFIFTRPTLQCFQNIHVPSPPFLIAILIHKWEIPWAKVFPLRLVLRLGYEYKMYPSPVISYANRKSAYFEIGHTIMNVLADFRNFHYTLSVVKDLFICVEEKKKVSLLIPKMSYEKVCKVLSTSNEHVLAFGGNLSLKADSHFVCVQNEDDDDIHSQYHTQLSSYQGSAQKLTGASFIVFSGALKSSTGLKAKMNIVEDGLLVQIPPAMMEELRSAIKDMKDFKIDCCKITENNSSEEWVQLKWVNDELSTNLGVRSQIDGLNLEGIQSARIFSNPDYANERYLIRWIEVFLLQINENSRRSEMINANKLAESVAQAFCVALIDYLDQLYENGLTKISLRISLDVDKVGYETGSGGKPLPPHITQPLDSALIPVIMENISTTGIEDPLKNETIDKSNTGYKYSRDYNYRSSQPNVLTTLVELTYFKERMDNNHISSSTNNSHSVTELGDRLNLLNVSDRNEQPLNASSRSLPSNYVDISMHNLSSRSNSSPNNSVATPQTQFSKLNPSAQEFVPRLNRTTNPLPPAMTTGPYRTITQILNAPISSNNHNFSNGGANVSNSNIHDTENYIEDYMSLSYLKDFINHISNKPCMYDQGINELTLIINSYLDEDDCVLELIVNQIVDQSIIDGNFRYNGVRLCDHFMENLRETSSGQSFKQLLFKRNQRECSRKVTDITSANTFIHLRGLALFTAELYSRCKASDLAEHLPSLLINILSSDIKRNENVKCVCDVLKLCGQQMEIYFASKGKQDFTNILDKLKETLKCDMSTHIKEMVKKILTLIENNWIQPQTVNTSNLINPYLNNSQGIMLEDGHFESTNNQYDSNYELYDFGNCGDENNAEVCQDFENFLKSTQQN